MRCFADTSFLCALYRDQDTSECADAFVAGFNGEIVVSSLVLWEFRQSARFQVFRHRNDRTKGFTKREAEQMLGALDANLEAKAIRLEAVEWPDVHSIAEHLSAIHTMSGGHRSMDILHLATARHLQLNQFLTFDANQVKLAEAERLRVPL
ncbi:MAG: type II toxin-antitoxin system VapC family toxin [Verrucomicrobiales bacterium]